MRALAWLGPSDGALLTTWGGDLDTMEHTGQLEPMPSAYPQRWDPPETGAAALDFGWVGADARGVWLALHPETALCLHPEVADVYEQVRLHPEMNRDDVRHLSAWEYTLAAAFVSAHGRRQIAEAKKGAKR